MAKNKDDKNEELEQLTPTENFFEKNKMFLLIGGIGIVLIVLGYVAYLKISVEPRIQESQDVYWSAFYEYQGADTTELAYEGSENFLGFADIAEEYDGTPAGEIANYGMATHAMEQERYEDALAYLEECDFDDIMIGTLVIGMMGDCYVELGDFDTAVEKFEEAAEREPNEYTSPLFLKKAGLVYEQIDQKPRAIELYQKIKDEWSESTQATDIDKFIARAQG